MLFNYKVNHLFHSNVTNYSWMIVDITEKEVKIRDMRHRETTLPYKSPLEFNYALADALYAKTYSREAFDKAIEQGTITFEKHAFQNQTIDGMRNHKYVKEEYAKNKHWGGTR